VIDQTSLSLSMHVMEQTIADLKAEGKPLPAGAARTAGDRENGEGTESPRPCGRGGFYEYPKDGKKFLWPELAKIFGRQGIAWDIEEMKDRILYRQAIETSRCLEEGVLTTVHDRQHRLHLRHWVPRLDRRCTAVYQLCRCLQNSLRARNQLPGNTANASRRQAPA